MERAPARPIGRPRIGSSRIRLALLAALTTVAAAALGSCAAPTATGGRGAGSGQDGGSGATAGTSRVELTIYAAASLKDALDALAAAYAAGNAGVALTVSIDSSAALEAQIEQGAPADVFLSADTVNPARLAAAGLTAGEPVAFTGNELAIAVAPDNPAGIETPFDLGRPGVRVVAAADAVPVSTYASVLIGNLAALPGAPAGFAHAYAANVLSKELNVKAVLAKIELGEGDAGIVYATDVPSSTVASIPIVPASANVRATYAGVVVRASARQAAAQAFLDWLAGPDGQAILVSFGFLPLP